MLAVSDTDGAAMPTFHSRGIADRTAEYAPLCFWRHRSCYCLIAWLVLVYFA